MATVARVVAASAAGAAALLHVLIGLGVLTITAEGAGVGDDVRVFGLTAGAGFAVAAVVVGQARHPAVHALVAALVVPVMIMYVVMSDVRDPHYEVWGLTIQLLEAVLVAALVLLVVRPRAGTGAAAPRGAVSATRSSARRPVPGSAGR